MNVIEFKNVWKKFRRGEKLNSLRDLIPNLFLSSLKLNEGLNEEEFWAVKDVSFGVKKGEVVGIIGPNGAGKSTVLKLLSGILRPNKGAVEINGRLSALIEVTAGFHPELTGRENIYLNGAILGMKRREIDKKLEEIIDFSGVSDFIDTPVKRYSSGMYSRLGFSVASHMEPDILLVDEVLAVGDIAFQAKCAQKMRELLNNGATIILVSHNLSLVQNLCKRVILLKKGEIVREGVAEEIIPYYEDIVAKQKEEELKRKITSSGYKVRINEEPLIEILDVSLNDGGSNQKESFDVDEHICVKILYEARESIDRPVFSLEIIRSDGIICCSSNMKDDGFYIENIQGKGAVKVDLGRLNLAPGIYVTKISVLDRDMIHPYAIRKRDIFRIETKGQNQQTKAIFLPKIEWELETNGR